MRWIFAKENEECNVRLQKTDGMNIDFSYIEMIKELYEEKRIDLAEFKGDFSESEKESVNVLIEEINRHAQDFLRDDNVEYDETL